jgi:GST-like protein
MIDLYGMSSPNVVKITIMLEECGLPYRHRYVNVFEGQQWSPEFLAIGPNNKVPVIVDDDGPGGTVHSVFESGAILLYLAGKTGRLLPADPLARSIATQWLMLQIASVGPMFGQHVHFLRYAPPGNEYGLERYTSEVRRIFGVLERRLATSTYLGGPEYTVADIATTPGEHALREWPSIRRWFELVGAREAVQRGVQAGEQFLQRDVEAFGRAQPEAFDRFFNRGKFTR